MLHFYASILFYTLTGTTLFAPPQPLLCTGQPKKCKDAGAWVQGTIGMSPPVFFLSSMHTNTSLPHSGHRMKQGMQMHKSCPPNCCARTPSSDAAKMQHRTPCPMCIPSFSYCSALHSNDDSHCAMTTMQPQLPCATTTTGPQGHHTTTTTCTRAQMRQQPHVHSAVARRR